MFKQTCFEMLVTYSFDGQVDGIYATLVVRLPFRGPAGQKRIALRFIAGFPGDGGNESRQGRKNVNAALLDDSFCPGGAWTGLLAVVPAMNR